MEGCYDGDDDVFMDAQAESDTATIDLEAAAGIDEEEGSLKDIGPRRGEEMQVELLQSISDTQRALDQFLNNQFELARSIVQPLSSQSIYHALGSCTISYLQASMTMERPDLQLAMEDTKRGLQVCQRFRLRPTIALRPISVRDYSDEQCHAELCFAELLMEKAMLAFMQDESLLSFLRSGLKIRECYKTYRLCWRMLTKRQWRCQQLKLHFESGARLGEGAFNLLLSLLPPRLLKLLEFVGFSASRQFGLEQLQLAASLQDSIRSPLVSIMLLAYHTTFTHVLGSGSSDLDCAQQLLQPYQLRYPNGALTHYFHGRLLLLSGNSREAVKAFDRSVDSQCEWQQLHLLCYWELMWAQAYAADWLMAMKYAEMLAADSKWSRATLLYQKASFLYHCRDGSEEAEAHVAALMAMASAQPNRSTIRSMPVERFAVQRAQQFRQQGRLTLPALELVYIWNGLPLAGKDTNVIAAYLAEIQSASDEIDQRRSGDCSFADDDRALVLLLKGACLKQRGQRHQAEQCFLEITDRLAPSVRRDNHVLAWAWLELALLHLEDGEWQKTRSCLEQCRSQKGGHLESRIQFRAHALQLQLQELTAKQRK